MIKPELESRLYPFMGGILRDLGCDLLSINGMPDHVHLLIRYRPDISHSELLRHVKGRSSKWIHEAFPGLWLIRLAGRLWRIHRQQVGGA